MQLNPPSWIPWWVLYVYYILGIGLFLWVAFRVFGPKSGKRHIHRHPDDEMDRERDEDIL